MNEQPSIRSATGDDIDRIRRLAIDNGLFGPDEMDGFDEMLAGYLDGSMVGHDWIVLERDGDIAGAAYYAPEPFADRLWNLYFIAVDGDHHRGGIGQELLSHVEALLITRGHDVARVLIVETSSLDEYDRARAFYRKNAFDEEARIRDFYGPGDDKIVFWKALPALQ